MYMPPCIRISALCSEMSGAHAILLNKTVIFTVGAKYYRCPQTGRKTKEPSSDATKLVDEDLLASRADSLPQRLIWRKEIIVHYCTLLYIIPLNHAVYYFISLRIRNL